MKLKFKHQAYQTKAVAAVIDCFKGQQKAAAVKYTIDPGRDGNGGAATLPGLEDAGFRNAELTLAESALLDNIRAVQRRQNLPVSPELVKSPICPVNLDVEMETGTGKTYCYIKTMFEMYGQFGWSKFIVVVPSIAIREGVYKSLEITAEHFQQDYGRRAKFFIYNSKQLHNLESFSSDAGINIMVINVQAFNAKGKDNRRIYEELDDFQSRRPIDVIKANHPVLILDEPQKMEGRATLDSLREFAPLMILRYSATHRTQHNKVHRLDALDAYNQKLVKKIAVRGISVKGLTGTNAYLYLEGIDISKQAPVARLEYEVRQAVGIRRITRKFRKGDNLHELAGGLDQYKGFVVAEIDAVRNAVSFTNGVELAAGEATGDVNETTLRRIQIREAIRAHLRKEQQLFHQGIKTLSLFFIDEVAKYRLYSEDGEAMSGDYARIFEEEYAACVGELATLLTPEYRQYLDGIRAAATHNGYFSIDRKTSRLVDPDVGRTATETEDVDAYDLILKDKERLLSFAEPTRFIFSHSALREGWDNPNVFVICTLKHSDNTVSRRQEVGRGLRIAVDQQGERQDDPATVHQTNVLTVVASESYKDFVAGLQRDIAAELSARPKKADKAYFTGKLLVTDDDTVPVTPEMAHQIYKYLVKNDYVDDQDGLSDNYLDAARENALAPLPEPLQHYREQILQLVDSVYSDAKLPMPEDERAGKTNPRNANFEKKEFQALWRRINHKAVYSVHFDSGELIAKCVPYLEKHLHITPLQYTVQRGEQRDLMTDEQLRAGDGFELRQTAIEYNRASVHSAVPYDLIGKIAEGVQLTRRTVAAILRTVDPLVLSQFKMNPESFIAEAVRLINEQKAAAVIEHLAYDPVAEKHDTTEIFTENQIVEDFGRAPGPLTRHIYDYVMTDSKNERAFVADLDTSSEVVVYAKLPKGFFIPTPVGNYNPDWAIAFDQDAVKHVYFVAETKGSISSMELRKVEEIRIECARKFFAKVNTAIAPENVRYDVVDSYGKLMEVVGVKK